jgi:hypothetical protein
MGKNRSGFFCLNFIIISLDSIVFQWVIIVNLLFPKHQ